MEEIRKDGNVSEWNEGNLKSLRLHEAQIMINTGKINPLKRIGDSWGFELWLSGINILYGEGQSKYSAPEMEVIERIRDLANNLKRMKPPFSLVIKKTMSKSSERAMPNYENWENLRRLVELYEQKVKFYNDKHGFSTRNQGHSGLFS
tara:strand:+ start:318 stop:761 length:444 start_codon:yes stop_codon:yes gene_type:complete